jgi:hypothetical protein
VHEEGAVNEDPNTIDIKSSKVCEVLGDYGDTFVDRLWLHSNSPKLHRLPTYGSRVAQ